MLKCVRGVVGDWRRSGMGVKVKKVYGKVDTEGVL